MRDETKNRRVGPGQLLYKMTLLSLQVTKTCHALPTELPVPSLHEESSNLKRPDLKILIRDNMGALHLTGHLYFQTPNV